MLELAVKIGIHFRLEFAGQLFGRNTVRRVLPPDDIKGTFVTRPSMFDSICTASPIILFSAPIILTYMLTEFHWNEWFTHGCSWTFLRVGCIVVLMKLCVVLQRRFLLWISRRCVQLQLTRNEATCTLEIAIWPSNLESLPIMPASLMLRSVHLLFLC